MHGMKRWPAAIFHKMRSSKNKVAKKARPLLKSMSKKKDDEEFQENFQNSEDDYTQSKRLRDPSPKLNFYGQNRDLFYTTVRDLSCLVMEVA